MPERIESQPHRRDESVAYQALWRENNRDKYNAYFRDRYHNPTKKRRPYKKQNLDGLSRSERNRWYTLWQQYQITREDYLSMVERQEGKCACCREECGERDLLVDHDHETGAVRDLLCKKCNTGLGMFRDNPTYCDYAASYLRFHNKKKEQGTQ